MKLTASTVSVSVAVVTLLITLGTGMFYLGTLTNQVGNLSVPVEDLLEEMRRSNERLLHSLANHTHDEAGNAVFTVPLGMEPTGAVPVPDLQLRVPPQ